MSDVLDIDRILGVIQRRCESLNVTLTFNPYARTASTNGKNITIPTVYHPVSTDAMTKLHGFVIHECGHHSRPEAFKILKALPQDKTPEELFALFNIMEDDGMERAVARAYAGDAIALGKQNSVILNELAEEWKDIEYPEDVTKEQVAPLAVTALGQLSRREWDGMSNSARRIFFDAIHPVARELAEELTQEGWVDKMQATTDAHECWDLAVDMFKRLYPDRDEEAEEAREQGHSEVPAPPQQGEPTECEGEGTGEGDGEVQEGEAEGEGIPQQGTIVSWKDAVLSEHNEWEPKADGAPPGTVGIDWTDYTKGGVCLMPQNLVNVLDLSDKKYKVEDRNDWCRIGKPESFMADNKEAAQFGNQIRRYIQSKAKTRVIKDKLHGRIDKGALFRLAMPPVDGGEWNKRIFYTHTDKPELDTCIHVLTDWSGSMMGEKMVQAADASGRLVTVFDRILRIPVQLAAFTDARSACDIGLIKRFDDHCSAQEIANRFSKFYRFSSANNDADALMWAYRQISRRKESRKILIVLSDGCPAGSYAGSSSSNLSYVTDSIQNRGDVELYGVGIQSHAVETYYKNCKVIQDPHMINNVLMEVIKEGVK